MPTRAKFYRAHRTHLDHATAEGIHVLTAGPLVADDGETPIGSLFIVESKDRATTRPSAASIRTASMACGRQSKFTPSSVGADGLHPIQRACDGSRRLYDQARPTVRICPRACQCPQLDRVDRTSANGMARSTQWNRMTMRSASPCRPRPPLRVHLPPRKGTHPGTNPHSGCQLRRPRLAGHQVQVNKMGSSSAAQILGVTRRDSACVWLPLVFGTPSQPLREKDALNAAKIASGSDPDARN